MPSACVAADDHVGDLASSDRSTCGVEAITEKEEESLSLITCSFTRIRFEGGGGEERRGER